LFDLQNQVLQTLVSLGVRIHAHRLTNEHMELAVERRLDANGALTSVDFERDPGRDDEALFHRTLHGGPARWRKTGQNHQAKYKTTGIHAASSAAQYDGLASAQKHTDPRSQPTKTIGTHSNFGTIVALVMHQLATFVVRPERGIAGAITTFHHKIGASAGIILQHLRRRSNEYQRLSRSGQPALGKAGMLAQPAQDAEQGKIFGFAHHHSLPDVKHVRQKPSAKGPRKYRQSAALSPFLTRNDDNNRKKYVVLVFDPPLRAREASDQKSPFLNPELEK
jgi:hypothetical protein